MYKKSGKQRIFVLSGFDQESMEIARMLKDAGYKPGTDLFVTGQTKYASWEKVEPETKKKLDNICRHGNCEICGVWFEEPNPYAQS